MDREELRNFWLDHDIIPCRMLDGAIAILIIGPSDSAVRRDNWRFGFQVHGEEDIRWRYANQLSRVGNALCETPDGREG